MLCILAAPVVAQGILWMQIVKLWPCTRVTLEVLYMNVILSGHDGRPIV